MKAVRVHRFGPPDVITFEDVERPIPGEGEVLVRVKAAGVGPWDAWIRAGKSVVQQPLPLTLGSDLCGAVEAIGAGAAGFRPGDGIFGVTNKQFTGAYAEYAVASAGMIARRPARLGDAEAAGRAGDRRHGLADAVRARPPGVRPDGAGARRRGQRGRLRRAAGAARGCAGDRDGVRR
jgi:hypothetical protein